MFLPKFYHIKMKSILFYIFVLISVVELHAQPAQAPITLYNGGSTRTFLVLDSAYIAANDGDTISLPAGTFNLTVNSGQLAKRLAIFGSGYRTDSCIATGITRMGGLNIQPAAARSYISGIYFSGNITGFANEVTISRSRLQTIEWRNATDNDVFVLKESVVTGYMTFIRGRNSIMNCIIDCPINNNINGGSNSYVFYNQCVFFSSVSILFSATITNLTVTNSIFFLSNLLTDRPSTQVFTNNLFVGARNFANVDTLISRGNVFQDITFRPNVFVRQSNLAFSEAQDYHIKPDCNCSDKGIYAGDSPFKEVPETPYILERQVAARPVGNQLQFRFRVRSNN